MLLKKKTILFCEEKRFSPAACVIEVDSFGANITVTPSAEKVFLYCDCGFSEAEKRNGSFYANGYKDKSIVAASINGKIYAEKSDFNLSDKCRKVLNGGASDRETDNPEFCKAADEVKIPYDDEAISTVNYYPEKYSKKAGIVRETCEKRDFLKSEEKSRGQYYTFYPQINHGEILNEGDCDEKNERAQSKESANATQKGNKDDACEEKNGASDFGGERGGESRLYALKEKTEAVLKEFPRERALERVTSGCRFARITYADDKRYVVGMSEDGGKPEYLFFGVPCKKGDKQPTEFASKAYFVPVGGEDGYFLLCQDFYSGEIL